MDKLLLDGSAYSVRFREAGMVLDLGSIGKGYALDRAATILREAGVESALLHGGTSTVVAIGGPPGEEEWQIGIGGPAELEVALGKVGLRDRALSYSGIWGRTLQVQGKRV